jgi:hypothetical protein
MLNPHVTVQRLTQGRPAAPMTLAAPRAAFREGEPATQEQGRGAPTGRKTPGGGGLDVHALAQRVYDLMHQDLRMERHRRGQWPW